MTLRTRHLKSALPQAARKHFYDKPVLWQLAVAFAPPGLTEYSAAWLNIIYRA
jgi:hypothetical protein